jgi:glycosidase
MRLFFSVLGLAWVLACSSKKDDATPVSPSPAPAQPYAQYGTPFANVPGTANAVVYEVNIRSMSDSGNFNGVISKLDHIRSLGTNVIWLMPIHPVGIERSVGGLGSPYAVRNYLEVNPEFGSLATFRRLVEEAHNRNMAVVLDWVANHTSWDNPWILNRDWYSQDATGNIIIPPGTNWNDVAELNFDNGSMRNAMINAMKYWVLQANVDGFRCDAADMVPADFWSQAINSLRGIRGRKLFLFAEGARADHFASGFSMTYGWNYFSNLKEVFANGRSANTAFTVHQSEMAAVPSGCALLRFTTNHDESAWDMSPVTAFGGSQAALAAFVATLGAGATPLIYTGQETARSQKTAFFTRDPINWSANTAYQDLYRKLMATYSNSAAFRSSTFENFSNADMVLFRKTAGTETLLVAVNVRNAVRSIALPASLKNKTYTNTQTDATENLGENLELPAYGFRVLVQAP